MAATRARRGDAPGTNLDAEARLALLEAILAEARGHRGAILETGLRRALPLLFAAAASRTFVIQDHRVPLVPTATTPEESMPSSPRATTPATPRPAATDDDDDGFECLGTVSAEARALESRRDAAAEGRILEIPKSPARPPARAAPPPATSPRMFAPRAAPPVTNPRAFAPPPTAALPVPVFMGRGTARRPVEPPAPAPSYGMRVGNQEDSGPRPVDEDADAGLWADY